MTQRERDRLVVLKKAKEQLITQEQAANRAACQRLVTIIPRMRA